VAGTLICRPATRSSSCRCHSHMCKSIGRENRTVVSKIPDYINSLPVPLPYSISILQNSGLHNSLRKIIKIKQDTASSREPGWRSRYSEWLRVEQPRGLSASPGRVKNFLFSMSSRLSLEHTQSPLSNGYRGGSFPGGKVAET
jgi:hypothetical protein